MLQANNAYKELGLENATELMGCLQLQAQQDIAERREDPTTRMVKYIGIFQSEDFVFIFQDCSTLRFCGKHKNGYWQVGYLRSTSRY